MRAARGGVFVAAQGQRPEVPALKGILGHPNSLSFIFVFCNRGSGSVDGALVGLLGLGASTLRGPPLNLPGLSLPCSLTCGYPTPKGVLQDLAPTSVLGPNPPPDPHPQEGRARIT